jgi:hypothetical protein
MDVRTDMTKLGVAFRNFVNAPKKECVLNKNIPGFSNKKKSPKMHSFPFKCFVDLDLNGAQVN